ncbi:MAG: helix-turn-helix transcriptional regulator [Lawsonibacter sp.]|jgi:transcriptional regulator with XRE-family HTH domain|nr:helix-turn-helix transcriptional regulator [Lawsonibacter sp.]
MDKNLLVDLGKRLKALRESKGLKQREMAEMMGLQLRRYQRYEYGEVSVPLDTLNFFADFFGVTADYLLGRGE